MMTNIIDQAQDDYMEISGLEQRKDIPYYEGWYQVSNIGRVRSLDRTIIRTRNRKIYDKRTRSFEWRNIEYKTEYKGQIILPTPSQDGYLKVNLSNGKQRKSLSIGKIVFCIFNNHDLLDFRGSVIHMNGNKKDNRLANLVWLYKEEADIAKLIFTNMKGKGISLDDVYDMLYKLRTKTGVNEASASKKYLDAEKYIGDFVEESNIGFDPDDDEYKGVNEFKLTDFFYRLQKKKMISDL